MIATGQLQGVPIFEGLSPGQLDLIASVARPFELAEGGVILREGDVGEEMYLLLHGNVEVSKRLGLMVEEDDLLTKRKTIVRLSAPQFFGEMGLLEYAERSATVIAASPCQLVEIRRADFERIVEADLALGYRVVRNICLGIAFRLRRTDRDVLKLTAALSLALGNR